MKKTLIAIAAMAAVSAFAQSSVTLYGILDVGFGGATINGVETIKFQQQSSYNSASRIGFKGTEDLGGGLKANFALETGAMSMEDGATAVSFTRAAWVGVGGAFGDVRLGRIVSKASAVMTQFDFNGNSASSALLNAGVSSVGWYGSSRRSSQLQYTKAFGDVAVHFANTLANDTAAPALGVTNKNRATVGLTFASGPWAAAGVAETAVSDIAGARTAYAVGASYDMKIAKFAATYNQRETEVLGKGVSISAVAPLGAANVGIQYAHNNGANVPATTVKTATELFANYALSKRTSVYVDSVFGGDTAGGSNKSYNLGVIHNF